MGLIRVFFDALWKGPKTEPGALELRLIRINRDLDEVQDLVRRIHQTVKRGETTQDHGLIGNLRCILDHVSPSPAPLV